MTNETTMQLGSRLIHRALTVMRENGGEMKGRDVINAVGEQVELDDWAKERYEKTGYIRWRSVLHFYTIDCVKAGYLVKKSGIWYLTAEGEAALKLGPERLLEAAKAAYRKWRQENPKQEVVASEDPFEDADEVSAESITLDQIEQIARLGLEDHIERKNAYEFQDLAAALLRGMGYFTPFVAPRGKDGGIDIVAYRDPLGTVSPRIKVQVKHRQQSATVQELRQLMGILQKDGDVGIFVSTGGFTPDAKIAARESLVHVELIDLNRFIELWVEFYSELDDEDKAHLPLTPVWFLAPTD
jgi:restriction system protein